MSDEHSGIPEFALERHLTILGKTGETNRITNDAWLTPIARYPSTIVGLTRDEVS